MIDNSHNELTSTPLQPLPTSTDSGRPNVPFGLKCSPTMDRTGYPKLADYVALEPQSAIFKRFGALNAENLFYMQAEIAGLEEELRQIVAEDTKSRDRKVQKFSKSWRVLQAARENSAQWQKRMEIRARLKEYSE